MVDHLIVSDPQILGGRTCVRGTRLSVGLLHEHAASDATKEQIIAHYPQLAPFGLGVGFWQQEDSR